MGLDLIVLGVGLLLSVYLHVKPTSANQYNPNNQYRQTFGGWNDPTRILGEKENEAALIFELSGRGIIGNEGVCVVSVYCAISATTVLSRLE